MIGPDETSLEGLPRTYLRPCLLLLVAEGPSHGYDLLAALPKLGVRQLDPGRVYRTLRALERERLVWSWWERSASGPPRRTYALTHVGAEWLHIWAGNLREVERVLGSYRARYESVLAAGEAPGG